MGLIFVKSFRKILHTLTKIDFGGGGGAAAITLKADQSFVSSKEVQKT